MFYKFVYHFVAPWIVWPFLRIFNRIKISGFERIPASGPAVIIANHRSMWDPVILFCRIRRRVYFIGKAELFDNWFLGFVLPRIGVFPVKRTQLDRSAIRRASEVLEQGHVLAIFPEGTRSKTGELMPFKGGAAFFAHRADAPVYPVYFDNTRKIFPLSIGQKVRVACEEPLDLAEFQEKKANAVVLEEMTAAFRGAIEEIAAAVRQEAKG